MKPYKEFALTMLLSIGAIVLMAQDGLDIDVDLDGPEWYESPLAYVALAVLLIIAILALRKRK